MKIFFRSLLLLLSMHASAASANPIIADLSTRSINIDSRFSGASILLFGSVKEPGEIYVAVRGPEKNFIVRKKERVGGVWFNTESYEFPNYPAYYSLASTRYINDPFRMDSANPVFGILSFSASAPAASQDSAALDAFLRIRQSRQLYNQTTGDITFMGDTLFKTMLIFPNTIPKGIYSAEVYFVSNGIIQGFQSIPITVEKVGFDAFVSNLAQNSPAFYGLAAVAVAVLAGWSAGEIFRRI